jgi:hypothetical protein
MNSPTVSDLTHEGERARPRETVQPATNENCETRQRAMIRELVALFADRSASETRITTTYQCETEAAQREHRESRQAIDDHYKKQTQSAQEKFRQASEALQADFDEEYAATEMEFQSSLTNITERAQVNEVATRKALQEAVWLAETVFEATETQPVEQFQQTKKGIEGTLQEFHDLEQRSGELLKRYRMRINVGVHRGGATLTSEPARDGQEAGLTSDQVLDESLNRASEIVQDAERLFMARLFRGLWPAAIVVLFVAAAAALAKWSAEVPTNRAMIVWCCGGLAASLILLAALYLIARSQMAHRLRALHDAIATRARFVSSAIATSERPTSATNPSCLRSPSAANIICNVSTKNIHSFFAS